jgi:hypothetical protein
MERELWKVISTRLKDVARRFDQKYVHLQPWRIAAVLLWAALHDRPVSWACDKHNWTTTRRRPGHIPSEATVSRRAAKTSFGIFLNARRAAFTGTAVPAWTLKVDGKPLPVGRCSKDPDAKPNQHGRGYKLHAIWGSRCVPETWEVTAANAYEGAVAERLLSQVTGKGVLLADASYEASRLYDAAAASGYLLLVRPGPEDTGCGHVYQSPYRQWALHWFADGLGQPPVLTPLRHRARLRPRGLVRGRVESAAQLGAAPRAREPMGLVQAHHQRRAHPPQPRADARIEIR